MLYIRKAETWWIIYNEIDTGFIRKLEILYDINGMNTEGVKYEVFFYKYKALQEIKK